MSLTSGTTLGPYQILSLLGAGGMGEVYKATDTRLDRPIAMPLSPGTTLGPYAVTAKIDEGGTGEAPS